MNLVVDDSVDRSIVERLRADGHDVIEIGIGKNQGVVVPFVPKRGSDVRGDGQGLRLL